MTKSSTALLFLLIRVEKQYPQITLKLRYNSCNVIRNYTLFAVPQLTWKSILCPKLYRKHNLRYIMRIDVSGRYGNRVLLHKAVSQQGKFN